MIGIEKGAIMMQNGRKQDEFLVSEDIFTIFIRIRWHLVIGKI